MFKKWVRAIKEFDSPTDRPLRNLLEPANR